ncbi:hypothetical protein DIPPA_07265 [Diplonema papillatum]|nr:hypothetical protein DIPPA_07265 [Diplonema papillatum]
MPASRERCVVASANTHVFPLGAAQQPENSAGYCSGSARVAGFRRGDALCTAGDERAECGELKAGDRAEKLPFWARGGVLLREGRIGMRGTDGDWTRELGRWTLGRPAAALGRLSERCAERSVCAASQVPIHTSSR